MTDCPNAEMRDLLPEYAHARLAAGDRARVEAHLAACAECTAELALIRAADRALGAAPRVDVARIVAALPRPESSSTPGSGRAAARIEGVTPLAPRRAAREAHLHRGSWRRAGAIAAVAMGAVGLALFGHEASRARRSSEPGVAVQSPQGSAVAAAQPGGAADSEGAEPGVAPRPVLASSAGAFGDLSDDALRSLLGEIDDLSDAPSTEPSAVLPAMMIDDEDTGS